MRDFLGWCKAVFDDLEYIFVRRQCEHSHHHAFNTRGRNKRVLGRAHVTRRRSEVVGFAMTVMANAAVNLRHRFSGH